MSYYTKAFAMFIFIYSLCFYLYILQCNSGFDLHIPLYLFSVHLLYNHCILIRYSYYIIVTYVDIIVVYIFLFDHGLIGISFHSIKQFSCRQLYTGILYVS